MQEVSVLAQINPQELTELANTIQELEKTRRWYEFGGAMLNVFAKACTTGHRREIFDTCVLKYAEMIDSYHLADLCIITAEDLGNPDEALEFLGSAPVNKAFDRDIEAKNLILLKTAAFHTEKKEFETALKIVQGVGSKIKDTTPGVIRAAYHKTQAFIDKIRGDHDAFYEHAFLQLSISQIDHDPDLAYDLCVAGLLADSVCSYGELAHHKIINSLTGTENEWIKDLVILLDMGSTESIDIYSEKFAPLVAKSPFFSKHSEQIHRKLAMAVFLEVIFARPYDSRVFTFDELAAACKMDKKDVELLVLKALSGGIIKGTLDQVVEKVTVTWCKPKGLSSDRVAHIKAELDRWISVVHTQRLSLESRSESVVG